MLFRRPCDSGSRLLLTAVLCCSVMPLAAAGPSAERWFVPDTVPAAVRARMTGKSMPSTPQQDISFDDLRYLRLRHVDFDGNEQTGELVCNKQIADDLAWIFEQLFNARYPIASIRLMDDFNASDDASMAANNSSCFNYRKIAGSGSLSRHALGMAVDINPLQNPYVKDGKVLPAEAAPYADRSSDFPHKIDANDLCCRLFRQRGFRWGGNWIHLKDYQHFEK